MERKKIEHTTKFLRDHQKKIGSAMEGWAVRGEGGNAVVLEKKPRGVENVVYKVSCHRQRENLTERLGRERRHLQEVYWGQLLKKKEVKQMTATFEDHITPPLDESKFTCIIMENLKDSHSLNYIRHPLQPNDAVSLLLTLVNNMMEAMDKLDSYFVHRDIKPANLMVQFSDTREPVASSIRLIDWGLAYIPGMKPRTRKSLQELFETLLQQYGGDEETQPEEVLQTTFLRITEAEANSVDKRSPCIDVKLLGAVYFFLRTRMFPSDLANRLSKRETREEGDEQQSRPPRGIQDLDFAELLLCEEVESETSLPKTERDRIHAWVSGYTPHLSQFAFELVRLCGGDAKRKIAMPPAELRSKCESLYDKYLHAITPFSEDPAWNRKVCMDVCRKWTKCLNHKIFQLGKRKEMQMRTSAFSGREVKYNPAEIIFDDKRRTFTWKTVLAPPHSTDTKENLYFVVRGTFHKGKVTVSMAMQPDKDKYDHNTLQELMVSHRLGQFTPSTYDPESWTDATFDAIVENIHNMHITPPG
mmetsp:Transcript_18174/g.45396  ORF Transcript_18174/g.45396 Transcript_18174/m.45396 type:complete len:530 (-) Transcript_18174:3316-4905(-)|eukprot:CAMPEP_0113874156 /NCGR_PEP_ID=MMETSP0780_2-20120614/4176_1 /TAXON_ID=652834 /ORGANISM="Palpitomonas bilix" /LENGTH=529 /DNA_ID=CAMNT_0000859895 /DNA_START=770 /DNA_END=2359 /DNA_ORIENTATION=- /assembly_acc=CAM_ASM_000599